MTERSTRALPRWTDERAESMVCIDGVHRVVVCVGIVADAYAEQELSIYIAPSSSVMAQRRINAVTTPERLTRTAYGNI